MKVNVTPIIGCTGPNDSDSSNCHKQLVLQDPTIVSIYHTFPNHIVLTSNDYTVKGDLQSNVKSELILRGAIVEQTDTIQV